MTEGVAQAQAEYRVYLGTYTTWSGGGKGIGIGVADRTTGRVRSTGVISNVANPSFVVVEGNRLYAVNESPQGAVTAVSLDGATPRVLNTKPTGGGDPCHLVVFQGHVISANYSSGSVSVNPIKADGSLGDRTDHVRHQGSGPDQSRQAGPHAHQVVVDPRREYVLAVDLGTDSVYTYRLAGGKLTPVSTARVQPGAGPRHLAFHPNGQYAYIANELDSTLVVASYANGVLTPLAKLPTVPSGTPANPRNYPAEVLVSADGRFVYVSNRGHDSIAVFSVEGDTVKLLETTPVGGKFPRHLALDASGKLLFASNQNSNTVTTFTVDQGSGRVKLASTFTAPIPVCVALKG
ncbi:lactonase family protein [Saccharothrix violaceirubra]|uniref:6-phosphogluconolactonase n=1 Tax=Saccharothrix violaceirubra TaxID=413306 RepID=A0A7W7WXM7_9PSEU|nr:lactonase family protein [Saccharothrix violaceirubra]MBB4967535.1 6-phosphogluconolactonase [Saccharothrix violaceirubra]